MDRKSLVIAAAAAAFTLPVAAAQAQHPIGIGIPDAKSPSIVGLPPGPSLSGGCGRAGSPHARVDRSSRCAGYGDGWAYADGEWALYNNRSWDSDSYNDWWHDRPDRAYPRWVQEQHMRGTCDPDRMWWSGSGWHC